MDAFAGRMKFIFDPANFIQCGCKPLEAYGKLASRTDYFHIKDARFADGRVVPVGAGDKGKIVIEGNKLTFDKLETPEREF